ncbi:MAG: copper resistance protein CopC [Actinomycetales bacterium]|nr:copper resistance protein CopC [Actinomycetales bacterium]
MRGQRIATIALSVLAPAVLALAPVASAHTSLVSSDPADGAVLRQAPQAVTLTFDEDLLAGANTISINLADGTVVESRPVEPSGPSVTLPWPSGLSAGDYQVAYRVVSGDGHPVTGAVSFTVTGEASPGPSVDGASDDGLSPNPAATPFAPPAPDVAVDGGSGLPVAASILAGAAGVAAVVVLIVLLRRRRR